MLLADGIPVSNDEIGSGQVGVAQQSRLNIPTVRCISSGAKRSSAAALKLQSGY
jgi:hypothetical protein